MAMFNREAAEQWKKDNPGVFESVENSKAARQKKLKELADQFETKDKITKALISRLNEAVEAGIIDDEEHQALVSRYKQAIYDQLSDADEIYNLYNPPEEPTRGERIMVPDAEDPSGYSEIEFEPGVLNRLVSNPDEMVKEYVRLRDSENKMDRLKLQAITQIASEDIIRRGQEAPTPPLSAPTEEPPSQATVRDAELARQGYGRAFGANIPLPSTIAELGASVVNKIRNTLSGNKASELQEKVKNQRRVV